MHGDGDEEGESRGDQLVRAEQLDQRPEQKEVDQEDAAADQRIAREQTGDAQREKAA